MPFPIEKNSLPLGVSGLAEDILRSQAVASPSGRISFSPDLTGWVTRSPWNIVDPPNIDFDPLGDNIQVFYPSIVSVILDVTLAQDETAEDFLTVFLLSPDNNQNGHGGQVSFLNRKAISSWRGELVPTRGGPWGIFPVILTALGTSVLQGHISVSVQRTQTYL